VEQKKISGYTRGEIKCQGEVSIPCWPVTPTMSPISRSGKQYDLKSRSVSQERLKEVGSWSFKFHCAGCYNLLLTGLIPIPLVQTYCTCLTELNPGTKDVPVQILKGFCRDYILGAEGYFSQKVRNINDFTVSASSKKSSIFFLIKKYFTYIIYDTSSWDLELTKCCILLIHCIYFFQI
jgi:hypothetical protein